MRMQREQFNSHQWLVNHEPLVVYGKGKKRDAAVIYRQCNIFSWARRFVCGDGPSEGTGPPYQPGLQNDTGPPDTG